MYWAEHPINLNDFKFNPLDAIRAVGRTIYENIPLKQTIMQAGVLFPTANLMYGIHSGDPLIMIAAGINLAISLALSYAAANPDHRFSKLLPKWFKKNFSSIKATAIFTTILATIGIVGLPLLMSAGIAHGLAFGLPYALFAVGNWIVTISNARKQAAEASAETAEQKKSRFTFLFNNIAARNIGGAAKFLGDKVFNTGTSLDAVTNNPVTWWYSAYFVAAVVGVVGALVGGAAVSPAALIVAFVSLALAAVTLSVNTYGLIKGYYKNAKGQDITETPLTLGATATLLLGAANLAVGNYIQVAQFAAAGGGEASFGWHLRKERLQAMVEAPSTEVVEKPEIKKGFVAAAYRALAAAGTTPYHIMEGAARFFRVKPLAIQPS